MDQRVSLITLGVADLARARRFYEEGLGWTPLKAMDEVCFYQLPGIAVSLFLKPGLEKDAKRTIDGSFSGIALALNGRSKAEVDEAFAQAQTAGATITKPPEDTFWGGYSGYFTDPDGHLWELAWNPQATIQADGTTTFEIPDDL